MDVDVPVFVLEPTGLIVLIADPDEDLEPVLDFVEDIETVIVLVVVEDGEGSKEASELLVKVVVRVDVLDCVAVEDSRTPLLFNILCSKSWCGLNAIEPITDNSRSHRIPLSN